MRYLQRLLLRTCAVVAVVLTSGCGRQEKAYLSFLYDSMPLPDKVMHSEAWWADNVSKTLEVRKRMGWDVPEREFRHFVLPLRVNNETLDDFRLVYADSICARVQGMSMAEAALEVNHWCHERATYRPSDARTSSPLATVRAGFGRCGEESVLAVAALRAAGIPARQVYTPRWAHTDDNHAWVEVFVDGDWHFMGACEPEPVLDLGWFNGSVSRAMLLHTRVFGDYDGPEDVISRTKAYTEINVIRGYVPARRTTVTVVDAQGAPVPDATVEFKIYNYAEYYTVASYQTDAEGHASLDTGLGDIMVWASSGDRFGLAKASSESVTVTLDHRFGEEFTLDFDIVPPKEDPLPSAATAEQTAENARRLAAEDAIRAARPHGNASVTDAFLAAHGDVAQQILSSLSAKDMNDVTADVLEDAFAHCKGDFDRWTDSPRIEIEALYPYFSEIGEGLSFTSPVDIYSWVCDNITVDDASNPQVLRIPPLFVWRSRVADSRSRDIFFVAMCRRFGFPARIDEVTGKAQYLEDGRWHDVVLAAEAPQGDLWLGIPEDSILDNPEYYSHFTLARIKDTGSALSADLLSFDEEASLDYASAFSYPIHLDEGYYMLTTGRRMADGGVLSRVSFFNVEEGERTIARLEMRSASDGLPVLGTFDAEKTFLPAQGVAEASILSATGRGYFAVAVLGRGDEPSNHAVRQLASAVPALNAWGRPVLVLGGLSLSSASRVPDPVPGLEHAVYGVDADGKVASMLASGAGVESFRLPVVIVGDSFGRIVYFSQGYNTSLAEDLRTVLEKL